MGDEDEVKQYEVVIEDYYDGFAVIVNGETFNIGQEESIQKLQEVFHAVGISAEYEEVC